MKRLFQILTPILVVILLACAVAYFAAYDPTLDLGIRDLESQTMEFLDQAERDFFAEIRIDSAKAIEHRDFYNEAQQKIRMLLIRAGQIERNDATIKNLDLLAGSFDLAKELHEGGFSSVEQIASVRASLGSHFRALIFLEEEKARQ